MSNDSDVECYSEAEYIQQHVEMADKSLSEHVILRHDVWEAGGLQCQPNGEQHRYVGRASGVAKWLAHRRTVRAGADAAGARGAGVRRSGILRVRRTPVLRVQGRLDASDPLRHHDRVYRTGELPV